MAMVNKCKSVTTLHYSREVLEQQAPGDSDTQYYFGYSTHV